MLWNWLTLTNQHPELILAQFKELKRQVPLLYALLMVNAIAVSYTHYGYAPNYLTIWLLGPLVTICGLRSFLWLRTSIENVTYTRALKQLRQTVFLSGILAGGFIIWSLALDGYGGDMERGHVSLFIAITVIGCIFCLINLPQAALLVMSVVTVPYIAYYISIDQNVFHAIALNIFLVSLVLIQVLLNGYSAFRDVIFSRMALAEKQHETEILSEENARLAHTDALTGLPNRRHFFSRLESTLAGASRENGAFTIGVVDLDRFKAVNDTYGHHFGDLLLQQVGDRLNGLSGKTPGLEISRLGGDEFGMIVQGEQDGLLALGQSINELVSCPYNIEGIQVTIGCSIGLASFPDAGRTAHELFDRSDYALYNSKTESRGQTTLYSSKHEQQIRSDRAIESALQAADLDSELNVYMQPILDLQRNEIAGYEALAQWSSPQLGVVPPDKFIPLAERTGLMRNLTLTLFGKALAGMASLPSRHYLSFNLSAHDITCSETVLLLLAAITQSKVAASRIMFEITETSVMDSYELAEKSIRLLRSTGAVIALDDFGTGYSSLSYLHRLPIDRVKIDKSFIAEGEDETSWKVITSIIALCRSMSLDCVVEGIETNEQRMHLKGLGCRYIQGHLIAEPMPAGEIGDWLRKSSYTSDEETLRRVLGADQ
nr:EAL domain-containing protein [Roseibium litorale]